MKDIITDVKFENNGSEIELKNEESIINVKLYTGEEYKGRYRFISTRLKLLICKLQGEVVDTLFEFEEIESIAVMG